MRTFLRKLIEHELFEKLIVAVILVNTVTLILEAIPVSQQPWKQILLGIDRTALAIFWVEAVLKIAAKGREYWKGWNLFDFAILLLTSMPAVGNFSALRALRIMRALRLFSVVPQFRFVAEAFVASIKTILATIGIITVITLIVSVMAVGILGTKHPEQFGTLTKSIFSMLQLMTLENWPGIIVPIYENASVGEALVYTLFFGAHFVVSTVALFNLLIAAVLKSIERPEGLSDKDIERIADAVAKRVSLKSGHD